MKIVLVLVFVSCLAYCASAACSGLTYSGSGSSSTWNIPFGQGNTSIRYQQIFNSSEFVEDNDTVVITGISIHFTGSNGSNHWVDSRIILATTGCPTFYPNQKSFSYYLGEPSRVVFSRNFTFSNNGGGYVTIQFDRPFIYIVGEGNLVIDIAFDPAPNSAPLGNFSVTTATGGALVSQWGYGGHSCQVADAQSSQFYSIQFCTTDVLPVSIIIRPFLNQNPAIINLDSLGCIKVAVLGSATFNVTSIKFLTVRFAGNEIVTKNPSHDPFAPPVPWKFYCDVNGDQYLDVILYFKIQGLDITYDSTLAYLTGYTHSGTAFEGSAAIQPIEVAYEAASGGYFDYFAHQLTSYLW